MRIEAQRVANLQNLQHSARLVILDRSVDTLLAHANALDRLYGYGVHGQARSLLSRLPFLHPDRTFYLDASVEALTSRRAHSKEPFDSFLLEPEFVGHFREYFTTNGPPISKRLSIVNAELELPAVAAHIARELLEGEEV